MQIVDYDNFDKNIANCIIKGAHLMKNTNIFGSIFKSKFCEVSFIMRVVLCELYYASFIMRVVLCEFFLCEFICYPNNIQ